MRVGIVPNARKCHCGTQMTLCNHANKVHGCEWKCYGKIKKAKKKATTCNTVVSIAKHSWFDNAQLKVVEVLDFLYHWWNRYYFTF
jgi:hypothetical protein